jgi:colanic acid/amylovoran biosynthesis glycosyltransferase
MALAYLLNSYPMTSTTFIRREIAAVEAAGVPVKRFAVRHWGEHLVDPDDKAEQAHTEYLLTGNVGALLPGLIGALFRHPARLIGTLPILLSLIRAVRGRVVHHVGYLLQAIYLRRRCETLGVTHIHAHFSTNAAAVALLCRLLGGPSYSFTVHGPDELVDPHSNGIGIKAAHARHIVAISHYCRDRLCDALPETLWGRIAIIPCGLDLDTFAPSAPATGPLLCIGRLCAEKAQAEIPAAIAALAEWYPDLRVDLIGDGDARMAIEQAIRDHKVADRVTLHGWRSNAEVAKMLAASRALLLPSHAEGLPIVIMEAFALGRPVIATRIAAIPELVDASCGWLFDAGSAGGLQNGIAAAMSADAATLAAMGAEGRQRMVARHDLRIIAPQLIGLFVG